MTDRPLPARMFGPAGALRTYGAAGRLAGDPTGLLVDRTHAGAAGRMVDDGAGLLVYPHAVTAAATDDEPASADPWHEQRLDAAADLLRWERKLETASRKALSAWTAVAAAAVLEDRYLTAAPGSGSLPPDPNAIPPLRSTWQKIAGAHILTAIGDLLGEVFARLLRSDQIATARPWQERYLGEVANRLVSVADSTFDLVRDVVRAGIDEGAAIPTIRDKVQEALDTSGESSWAGRAQTIARTETIGAYNGGHLAAWEVLEDLTGEVVHKVWLATIDGRTRDSHFRADGQRAPLGQPFRVGGHDLAHPGDPTAPVEEVINCRCTMLELAEDEPTPDVADRGWRDPAEVAAEISRRADLDPPVVRAYDDPSASLQAAARAAAARPPSAFVAAQDRVFRGSYADPDELLAASDDTGHVAPALVAKVLGALPAAGVHVGIAGDDHYDPNQRRDQNGKWTKLGVGISISVKDGPDEHASFTSPTDELLRVTYEHEFTGTDGKPYQSVVTRIRPDDEHPNSTEVSITITAPGGKEVGWSTRYIRQTPDGPQAYHDALMLAKDRQGLGIGTQFNQRAEEVYRAAGVTHIALNAYSEPEAGMVGGYVWARRGFGWANTDGPKDVAAQLRRLSGKQMEPAVRDYVTRLEGDDLAAMPTPFEVSQLTGVGDRLAPGEDRIGHAALLQEAWDGVRWLPQDEEEAAAGHPDATPLPAAREPLRGDAAAAALNDLATKAPPAEDYDLELESLMDYRTTGYQAINAHLRGLTDARNFAGKLIGPPTPDQLEEIADLRAAADRHRLEQPIEVWRGLSGKAAFLPPKGKAVGTVVTDPGFMSTTLDSGVASDFLGDDGDVALRIIVPKGHPVIPMEALSGGGDAAPEEIAEEREVVLPPGSSFRITGEEISDGMRVLTAEVLPYGTPVAGKPDVVPADEPAAPSGPEPLRGKDALASAFDTVTDEPTPQQNFAVRVYKQSGYLTINALLRDDNRFGVLPLSPEREAKTREYIDALTGMAEAHTLPEPVVVHRGIAGASTVLPEGASVGAVVTDRGFLSTTANPKAVEKFADGDDQAVFELTVPAGHPTLPVDQLLNFHDGNQTTESFDYSEAELVLPPGSAFRITGDSRDANGRRILTAEVLPYGGDEAKAAAAAGEPVEAPTDPVDALFDGALSGQAALDSAGSAVTRELSPAAVDGLDYYTSDGSANLNSALRGVFGDPQQALADLDPEDRDALTAVTRIAADHPLPADVEVFRGVMDAGAMLPEGDVVGQVLTDPAFMSVTTDRQLAETLFTAYGKDPAVFRLRVPAGHPAVPVDRLLGKRGESELVLPPRSSFRIVADHRDEHGRRVITGEVLPHDEQAATGSGDMSLATAAVVAPLDGSLPDAAPDDAPAAAAEHGFRALPTPAAGDAFLRDNFDPKALSKPEKEALGYWTSGNYRKVNELLRTGSLEVERLRSPNEYEREGPLAGVKITKPAVRESRTVHSVADLRAFAAEDGFFEDGATLARLADQIDNLPAAIGRHQLPEDMSLFRVATMPDLAHADRESLLGSLITDRGFVATSTSDKSAVLVTSQALGVRGDDTVLFEIRTPAGTPFATPELPMGTVNGTKLGGYTRVQEVLLNPSSFRVVDVRDDEVDTSGLSLKKGAIVKPDAKAKREPVKVRRVVVELVDPNSSPAPESARAPDAPAVPAPKLDAPVVHAPAVEVPEGSVASAPDTNAPPLRITAARRTALDYYAVPVDQRSGKAPNYSVYMPLLGAGLIERDEHGKYVATDAGHAARTAADAIPAKDLAPDLPADVPPATGLEAHAAFQSNAGLILGERAAVNAYVNENNYASLNDGLRAAGDGPLTREHILATFDPAFAESTMGGRRADELLGRAAALDDVLAAVPPSTQPVTLLRGVADVGAVFGTEDPAELVGATLLERSYLSTTANPDVAEYFATGADRGRPRDGAIVRINAPAGTRGLQIGSYESPGGAITAGGEGEVLLPRGATMRVTAVSTERNYLGADRTVIDVDLVPAGDRRDASSGGAAAPSTPSTPGRAAAADVAGDPAGALDAEAKAATAKAEKKAAAAAKKLAKQQAADDAARAAALAEKHDDNGYPLALSYDYLIGLDDEQREDLEVSLIEGIAAGDPVAEKRLDDLALFNESQAVQDDLGAQEGSLGTAGVDREIADWLDTNGKPGLTHPAVGGNSNPLGVPSMKQVQEEYRQYVYEQWLAAEAATNGYMVTGRGERLGKTGLDMFSSKRGVADVMQYASEELLDWFEQNRRIAWAEFYYERTRSPAYAAKATAARQVSVRINRDRSALKADAGAPLEQPATVVVAAARRAPAAPALPTAKQLDAYAAGRAAHDAGQPATSCPFDPAHAAKDHQGLFTLWLRGWLAGQSAAAITAAAAAGLIRDPNADRLGWTDSAPLVLPATPHGGDPGDRLLAVDGELTVHAAHGLPASAAPVGQTVTAAGSGPGDASASEGRHPMPRSWKSAPYLAPFGVATGDGRIFKVGSLSARELPLPLLFQPSSGYGHDGSVVVGRILAAEFTDAGIVSSGDYLDADAATNPDLAKAIEQAVALTEAGLGHVSVDLSDVVGELVDGDGNPVSWEDIMNAWDRGEEPEVLEQVIEGKLIACTQVATPAFEGAKIELSSDAAPAADPAAVDPQAALEDASGAAIAVGAVVDVDTADGSIRGEVTAVDEAAESVTVQPTDDNGDPTDGDPLVVAPAAVTVVTAAPDPKAAAEQNAEASLLAAAGPLRPPAAWFEDPKLPGPTAMTITDDGRVYGHVAVWGACHVGFSNTCVTPPTSPSKYARFHVGEVVTEDGSRIAVGNLTLGGKHADVRLAYRSAIEHYDVSGAGTAVVRCYEDEHGIAFAGALTPGVTEEQIYDMRRSPVSGDWRRVGGELEMIGVLSVNSGGFNTPRFATDEAGRTALVAAPGVRPEEDALVASGKRRGGITTRELVARVTKDVAAQVRRELAAESAAAERSRRLKGLAVSIKADPRSRMALLAAKVDAPRRQERVSRLAELAAKVGA